MQRLTAIVVFLLTFNKLFSQVEFSPKDATWNYLFQLVPAWNGTITCINEQIVYSKDTIIGLDSIKILTHKQYYNSCYNKSTLTTKKTLLKQKGDTIYFNNPRTQNTWQILYNFAATPGNGWQTTMLKADNTPTTHVFVVDSTSQISLNGYNLKRLYLKGGSTITERYGSSGFLFNFNSYANGCDGYYFYDFLCYSDKALGKINFGHLSCDFFGTVPISGINNEKNTLLLQISPNPVNGSFKVHFPINSHNKNKMILRDSFGRELLVLVDVQEGDEINTQNFSPGIYFLEIQNLDGRLVQKIINE